VQLVYCQSTHAAKMSMWLLEDVAEASGLACVLCTYRRSFLAM